MNASIIIVANQRANKDCLDAVIERHRAHNCQIIIVYQDDGPAVSADVVLRVPGSVVSLSKCRNAGAKATSSDWLLFADADTIYQSLPELPACGAFRGEWRKDAMCMDGEIASPNYHVVAAPMGVRRDVFEKVGGYNEGYAGYGHEDCDFLHKLPECIAVDTGAIHLLNMHWGWGNDDWNRGREINRQHYAARCVIPLEQRIAEDVAAYRR
jgi:hypothetical protein